MWEGKEGKEKRRRLTLLNSALVDESRLVAENLVDSLDLSRKRSVDLGSGLDRLDGSTFLYKRTNKKKEGGDGELRVSSDEDGQTEVVSLFRAGAGRERG